MNLVPALRQPTILQILPALISGGVERGTIDTALYIKQRGWNAVVASSGGAMARELDRAQIPHLELPLNSKNPLTIWRNAKKLQAIIEKYGVNLIHARSRAPAWSGYLAAQKCGIPFVTSFHGAYNYGGKLKKRYNAIMARGERVIAVSQFIRHHIMAHYGLDTSKIDVVPRGIDLLRFNPQSVHPDRVVKLAGEWRIPDDKPIVLLPGRISRWKGQKELLLALSRLSHKNFHCVFVGSDHGHASFRKEIEKLVMELQMGDLVKWVGECKDMPAAYMLADVVVSASTQPEAFGRVVVEAQAMGRPVVATDHGGSAETIINNETGFLCAPGNMSKTIQQVLQLNAQARERLGHAAIAHIRAHYSVDKMCAGEFAVYEKVLENRAISSIAA